MRWLLASVIAMLPVHPLLASELTPWGEAAGWQILVDPDAGNGCLARRTFDDDLMVEVGSVPKEEGGFFAAYNPEWTDIEAGVEGTLNFDFGDAKFAGDAVGAVRDGIPGGYAFFDNPEFVSEFGKRHTVVVSGDGDEEIEVDLSGSTKAIAAVLACQDEQPDPPSE